MSFAAPLFLLAALAGIVPILLHLIHRQRAKEVPFPTLRFLRLSVEKTRRRKYVDDAALLLLRVAVLVLLALGLARPALNSLRGLLGAGAGRAVAIVLDNSGSMALQAGEATRFDTARERVNQILDGLVEGDAVALLLTGGPVTPAQNRLVQAHETIRQELDQASPVPERADLAARLQQARELLARSPSTRRELYVVTDDQALSWEGLATPQTGKAEPDRTPVLIADVRGEPMLNVALRELKLTTPAPIAGAPVQLRATVANPGAVPQQKTLELRIDGTRQALSPTLTIPAGGAVAQEFRFAVDRPGVHPGEVRIVEDDASALDNRLAFPLTIDPPIPVTILKARRHEIPQADDAFYLERALASGQGGASGGVRIVTLTPSELPRAALGGEAAVFCVNLPALDAAGAESLRAYARGGGHLVWIAGPNVQPAAYNQMNTLAKGDLLPAPVEPARAPAAGAPSWHIAALDTDHPALAPLAEPASLYRTVLVHTLHPLAATTDTKARVLARLDDGQPLLVERPVGSGSVLWLGTSARPDATNLPLKSLFLPLIARLTYHFAGVGTDQGQVLAGAPLAIPLPANAAEIEVVRPSGEVLRLKPTPPGATTFRYTDTHDPGVYLLRPTVAKPPRTYAFAVNPDPAESTPALLTRDELARRFGSRPYAYAANADELSAAIRRLREGTSLRDSFLALVLVGLVFEAFLANRKKTLPTAEPPVTPSAPTTTPPADPARIEIAPGQVISLGS